MALTKEERAVKLAEIRAHHQPTFDYLNIPPTSFIPRYLNTKFAPEGASLWFESDLKKGEDLYTEVVADADLNTIPGKRDLYKIKHNPHWEEEYQRVKIGITNYVSIPFSEYQKVEIKKEHITEQKLAMISDEPFSNLTIRDLYAMLHNIPVSKKAWLNETIEENQR